MRRRNTKRKRHLRGHGRFRAIGGFVLLVFITAFAVPVMAEEAKEPVPVAEAEGPVEKLVEGIEETATGWTEVPREIAETSEEANPIEGVTVGAIKGAGEAIVETAEGAVKAATFYIPEEGEEAPEEKPEEEIEVEAEAEE